MVLGCVAGLALAAAFTRLLARILFGASPWGCDHHGRSCAGKQTVGIVSAARDAVSNFRPVGRPQAEEPSLSPIAHWELPPEDVVEDDARVYADSINLIPAITDHKV